MCDNCRTVILIEQFYTYRTVYLSEYKLVNTQLSLLKIKPEFFLLYEDFVANKA